MKKYLSTVIIGIVISIAISIYTYSYINNKLEIIHNNMDIIFEQNEAIYLKLNPPIKSSLKGDYYIYHLGDYKVWISKDSILKKIEYVNNF